ncbi:MAG: DnaD domain protein [Anaerolineales bacterium]|nr:DnaD domain protein [Anaerolineales bacterium]
MKGFSGFPARKTRTTPVPNLFFSELLPKIDDLDELKLTLYCFWRLALKEGRLRHLRRSELQQDETLLASFQQPSEAALFQALESACARGTLLHVAVEGAAEREDYYFLNTPKGRAAVEGISRGDWLPTNKADHPISVTVERPNIFTLYEQNIGALTPLIADELLDAERNFPANWLKEAVRTAVENNARSWRYVLAILERWKREGKDDHGKGRADTEKTRRRYLDYLES